MNPGSPSALGSGPCADFIAWMPHCSWAGTVGDSLLAAVPPVDVVVRQPLPGGVRAHVSTAVPFTHLAAAPWVQGPWRSLASIGLAPAAISLAPQRSDGTGCLCVSFGRRESLSL